jgi:hypothetical protein
VIEGSPQVDTFRRRSRQDLLLNRLRERLVDPGTALLVAPEDIKAAAMRMADRSLQIGYNSTSAPRNGVLQSAIE